MAELLDFPPKSKEGAGYLRSKSRHQVQPPGQTHRGKQEVRHPGWHGTCTVFKVSPLVLVAGLTFLKILFAFLNDAALICRALADVVVVSGSL